MHKEIEEAREWAKIHRAASTKISFGAQAIRHIERLLDLFDRMQQEPRTLVTEHFRGGKWVPENGTMNPQMGGDKKRIARYRRELEDK